MCGRRGSCVLTEVKRFGFVRVVFVSGGVLPAHSWLVFSVGGRGRGLGRAGFRFVSDFSRGAPRVARVRVDRIIVLELSKY